LQAIRVISSSQWHIINTCTVCNCIYTLI
jgi:hypothetical protein